MCTVAGGRAVYPVDRSARHAECLKVLPGVRLLVVLVERWEFWGVCPSNSIGYSHFVAGTVHASVLGAMPRTHSSVCCACHVHNGSNIQSHSIILTAKLF